MTEQSTFEQGHRSSELDDLAMFKDEGTGIFDAEELHEGDDHLEEINPDDHAHDDRHDHDDDRGEHADGDQPSDGHPRLFGGGGIVGLAVGSVLTVAGVCLMLTMSLAPGFAETLTALLAKFGLTAMSLILAGLVVFGFALTALRQNKLISTIHSAHGERERLESGLDYLIRAQEHHLDRPPASGEELDRVLLCLQRQDEKLNNLTKAIKMYGKPLVEISNQSSEAIHHLEELHRQTIKIAEAVQGQEGQAAGDLRELLESNRGLTEEDLHRELETQLETHVEKLEARIEESAKRVAGGVDRLLERDDTSSEPALEAIQRGLKSVADTLSAVQQSIAQGVRSAPAPQPQSAAPRSEPAPAPQSSPSSGGSGIGGLAHSIAGPKKGAGKNVLGAIAKLKQMRN